MLLRALHGSNFPSFLKTKPDKPEKILKNLQKAQKSSEKLKKP